ncbi:MAG: RagB/SusD family nutrient uptake outer membrane protein [Rikenellaceae bacterium]|nr:RagB/SusD family nutrient uptake outer membrane protein [Rikenellaceae bacterium]
MKKLIFLALGCSLLFAPSCKDFLEKNPTASPSEAIFWQSKNDFDQALTAIYTGVRGGISFKQSLTTGYISSYISFWDNMSDNSIEANTNVSGASVVLTDQITPTYFPTFGGIYSYCYSNIARINIFLSRLDEYFEDKTDESYIQLKGEAVGLRGLLYYYLYVCFGEVPVTKEAPVVENMYVDKSDREAVYKAVVEDFNEAATLLGTNETYMNRPGRMTGAAATAFCARTMLYHAYDDKGVAKKAEMEEVLTKLNTITAPYSLATDVLDNFHSSKQSACPEIMFSLRYLKPTMRNQIDYLVGDQKAILPTRDLVYDFPMADGNTAFDPSTVANIDKMYDKTITEAERLAIYDAIFANRDPRLAKFITHNDVYDFSAYLPDNVANAVTSGNNSATYFDVFKLVTPIDNAEGGWNQGYDWQGDQDAVLLRWAHVLLMKAEAAFESGDETGAKNYINEMRRGYGIPELTSIDRDILRREIRIETCFEGLRYFDMKRWRILDKMNGKVQDPSMPNVSKVIVNPAHFDWPIPQDQIDVYEDNGHTLTQNPNYK